MLYGELSKEIKKHPEIEYAIPKRIFAEDEPGSGQDDNKMVKLFSFAEAKF